MQPDRSSESFLSAGLKTLALSVLLGLIALVSEPVLRSSAITDEAQALAVPSAAATAAPAGSGDTTYFPSQYPAPTTLADHPPMF